MKTAELLSKLSKKYPSPQYAFLSNVRNQTGFGSSVRTADALALGLWPSRGNFLHGFELKVSRSDWMHEVKKPEKAEAIVKYCDMFSLVITDLKIIDISEVPKTWGIMIAKSGTIKTHREAPMLKAKPMTRDFLCGFLRKISQQIDSTYTRTSEVETIIKDRVKIGVKYGIEDAVKNAGKYEELIENLKKFEKASGINLTQLEYSWHKPEEIGKAVKMVLDGKDKSLIKRFGYIKDSAERILESVEEEIKLLRTK